MADMDGKVGGATECPAQPSGDSHTRVKVGGTIAFMWVGLELCHLLSPSEPNRMPLAGSISYFCPLWWAHPRGFEYVGRVREGKEPKQQTNKHFCLAYVLVEEESCLGEGGWGGGAPASLLLAIPG